jgi:hypothetical protein
LLVVAVALVMAVPVVVLVARAERERTDTQVRTLRDAILGEDSYDRQRHSGPDMGGFLGHKQNGVWGEARVARTPEDVLRDLATGAASAGIKEPVCVRPAEPPVELHEVLVAVYACDLTRGWLPFGWIRVTPLWTEPGEELETMVRYGLGPDAGSSLHEFRSAPEHEVTSGADGKALACPPTHERCARPCRPDDAATRWPEGVPAA